MDIMINQMSETTSTPQTTAEQIQELYPQYMEMIRAFVSEGIIEVDQPTDLQTKWAHKAALGNVAIEPSLAQLARVTEQAHKQRYLEGMPMLIDLDSAPDGAHNGFESVERFHFIRLFVKDFYQFDAEPRSEELPGVHPVLFAYNTEG